MGFLRKVGKKIKNGVSKLLGGKFGKILGGIGLAMMFWGGASALFGNQGWFQGLKTNLAKMNPFGSQSVTQASEVAINSLPETTTGIDKLVGAGTDAAAQASAVSVDPTKFEKFLAGDLSKVEALDTAKFSELDFGSKIAKVGVETGKGFYKAGESVGGYLKGIPEGKKSVALSVTLQPTKATLTEAEIEATSAAIIAAVEKHCGGVLRS